MMRALLAPGLRVASEAAMAAMAVLAAVAVPAVLAAAPAMAEGPGRAAPAASDAAGQSAPPAPTVPAADGRDTASGRFLLLDGQTTVADRGSSLVWQRCSVGQQYRDGLGCVGLARKLWFAEAASLESREWRLPSTAELRTLYNARLQALADDEAFPDSPPTWFWARGPGGAPAALGVSCGSGGNDSCYQADARAVRLVRRTPMVWPAR